MELLLNTMFVVSGVFFYFLQSGQTDITETTNTAWKTGSAQALKSCHLIVHLHNEIQEAMHRKIIFALSFVIIVIEYVYNDGGALNVIYCVFYIQITCLLTQAAVYHTVVCALLCAVCKDVGILLLYVRLVNQKGK